MDLIDCKSHLLEINNLQCDKHFSDVVHYCSALDVDFF